MSWSFYLSTLRRLDQDACRLWKEGRKEGGRRKVEFFSILFDQGELKWTEIHKGVVALREMGTHIAGSWCCLGSWKLLHHRSLFREFGLLVAPQEGKEGSRWGERMHSNGYLMYYEETVNLSPFFFVDVTRWVSLGGHASSAWSGARWWRRRLAQARCWPPPSAQKLRGVQCSTWAWALFHCERKKKLRKQSTIED